MVQVKTQSKNRFKQAVVDRMNLEDKGMSQGNYVTKIDSELSDILSNNSIEDVLETPEFKNKLLKSAKANVYSKVSRIDKQCLSDFFISLEQAPYDAIVKHIIIPERLKEQFQNKIFSDENMSYTESGNQYIWNAKVLFADCDMIVGVGLGLGPEGWNAGQKYIVHGMEVANE